MDDLKFDHIIHYIDHLNQFKYPGDILKINAGGKHHKYGTFNRLSYINDNYIKLLDVEDIEKLKKEAKTNEGRVSFATKIVQDGFKEGFKTVCFRTNDIARVKTELEEKSVEVIGPVKMHRENKKGDQLSWKLLYIADPDYMVKPPFFIEWDEKEEVRQERYQSLNQEQYRIKNIVINSAKREKTVAKWQLWFDMTIIENTEFYTVLKLKNDDITFRIRDNKTSGYESLIIEDSETQTPYKVGIRGAKYKFIPSND